MMTNNNLGYNLYTTENYRADGESVNLPSTLKRA